MIRNVAAILLLLGACAARAEQHPGIDEYLAAADRFERLAASSATPPRIADPVAGAMLRRLTDSRATFGDDRYGEDDLQLLHAIMERNHRIGVIYANRGIGPDMPSAAAAEREAENTAEFQDEITPVLVFALDGFARFIELFVEHDVPDRAVAETSEGRRLLRETRSGVEEMVDTMIDTASWARFRAANRLALVEALERNMAVCSAALSLPQRQRLTARIRSFRADFPPAADARLDRILEILGATACEGLCAA